LTVIPAQAGIQNGFKRNWIPAFAGMTNPLGTLSGVAFQKAKLISSLETLGTDSEVIAICA
jgi:hypothetical protein